MAKTDQLKKLPFEGKVAVLAGATDGWDDYDNLNDNLALEFLKIEINLFTKHCCKRIGRFISFSIRIGYAIADRLARDGAKVMISSRKQVNVDKAVESLRKQHGIESVSGVICHVGKDEDRKRLIKEVREVHLW